MDYADKIFMSILILFLFILGVIAVLKERVLAIISRTKTDGIPIHHTSDLTYWL
jgi:hypothetical protein